MVFLIFLFFLQALRKRSGRLVTDEGWYHCVARNSLGALVSRNASLQVAGASLFRCFSCRFFSVSAPKKKNTRHHGGDTPASVNKPQETAERNENASTDSVR